MKIRFPLLLSVFVVLLVVAMVYQSDAPANLSADESLSATPGYRVVIDPSTGEFVNNPSADALPEQYAPNASSKNFVEQPSPVAGGGTMVDIRGQFQQNYVATVDAEGNVEAECVPAENEDSNSEKE